MGTTLATYYAKLQDMPDSEYKVEILEDGPIKKIAVNGKIYEVDYNMGGDSIHSIIIDHHSHGVQISPSSNNSATPAQPHRPHIPLHSPLSHNRLSSPASYVRRRRNTWRTG